jgi:hypothetical protein
VFWAVASDASDACQRTNRIERALLSGQHLVADRVDDLGDRLVAELGADRGGEMMPDVTDRPPARVERHDDVVVVVVVNQDGVIGVDEASRVLSPLRPNTEYGYD